MPSSNVVLGTSGKVTADVQTSAVASIEGFDLLKEEGDGYYILAVNNGSSNFMVNSRNKIEAFDAKNATDPNYLWKMTGEQDPITKAWVYWFQNKATGKYLEADATQGTGIGGRFSSVAGTAYNNGLYMYLNSSDGSTLNNIEGGSDTYYYWGLYESGEKAFTAEFLNDIEGNSFALTITANRKNPDELLGAEAFGSSIVAEPIEGNETSYRFKVGDKYIVLDKEDSWSEEGIKPNEDGYKFTTVEADQLSKSRYVSAFTIYYRAGEKTTVDANGNIQPTAETAIERIEVGGLTISTYNSDGKDYLTVSNDEDLYAKITFGGGNRTDIVTLLTGKFATIQFVNKELKDDKAQQYKDGKMLAIEANDDLYKTPVAEYVGTTKAEYPEAQWAISLNPNGTAKFTNRENPKVTVDNVVLYNTDEKGVYAVTSVDAGNVAAQDTLKLTFVTTGMFDGFKYVSDIEALQDTVYNIAASKAVNNVNDAYWVEKNHSTTHQIGLDGDIENAGEWNLHVAMKAQLNADGEVVKNAKGEPVMVPDTVFVKSTLYTWDSQKQQPKPQESVLAIFPYAIQNNDNNEYVKYDGTHGVEYYVADKGNTKYPNSADRFALKIQNDGYHIVTLGEIDITKDNQSIYGNYDNELGESTIAYVMKDKVFAGNAASQGTLAKIDNYVTRFNDVMTITPVAMPEYRPVVKANESAFDTVRIYRDENHSQLLYEKKDQKSGISFLNIDNENQFKLADAIFVDTAYVNRGTNTCWQYLLVVEPNNVSEWYCPVNEEHNTEAWREANGVEHCHDAIRKNYVEGRFLINLMDTANVYEATTQHENPYIYEVEAGGEMAKLAFVPGKHFGDSLVIYADEAMTQVKDSLFLGDKDFNIAKFAFRYVDNEAGSFKIQTQYKNWKEGNLKVEDNVHNNGYLRWVNGTVVVAPSYEEGDVFNMTENYTEGNPTANESIEANGAVSVVAADGGVIVRGAEGKNVVVSTILGKVVANETLTSDNETIAAPAGIVVVSVDGESFKVVVK